MRTEDARTPHVQQLVFNLNSNMFDVDVKYRRLLSDSIQFHNIDICKPGFSQLNYS